VARAGQGHDQVQHIMNELRILTTFGQSRLDSLTAQIGTGVVLVNSKYINSSDISDIDRDTSDKEVRGEFTAGPNRHPFDIVLLTEHCGDTISRSLGLDSKLVTTSPINIIFFR